jgi:thiopurine S-methyltransferase
VLADRHRYACEHTSLNPRVPHKDFMHTQFWHERWQKNEIGFHQAEFNSHLQEFWPRLGLTAQHTVFVPLCGKSRDLLWLRAQGYPVLGVELSPIAVRDFFAENRIAAHVARGDFFEKWSADGLTILCGDFFSLTHEHLREVGGVFDRASLIALPPDMRPRYAHHLSAILPSQAVMLLVTMEYTSGAMQGPPFSVEETEVRRLYKDRYRVESVLRKDILNDSPRFRERGLSALHEHVYRLEPLRR